MRRREFIAFLGSMGVAATSGAFAQTPGFTESVHLLLRRRFQ
jgi:hypothetical protein